MTKELTEAEKAQNVSTILGISLNEERKTSQLYLEKVNELRAELASLRAHPEEEHRGCIPIEEHLATTGELARTKSYSDNLGDLLAKREEEIERLSALRAERSELRAERSELRARVERINEWARQNAQEIDLNELFAILEENA